MTRLLIIGPPGSGKGTQAEHLARHFNVPAVSTGDIFRSNVNKETELGRQAAGYLDGGSFVPDHLTNALIKDRLQDPDLRSGFLLDGYPRTAPQVAELDNMLAQPGQGAGCRHRTAGPGCRTGAAHAPAGHRSRAARMTPWRSSAAGWSSTTGKHMK